MAQTSGFFEAEWDAELYNEETQTYGDWDRKYLAEQFARYFQHFVSNGVMNDVENQLKVTAGTGMNVVVSSGFAFINGFWYYNSEQLVLAVPLNETPSTRYDSVRIRWNDTTRSIECIYVTDSIINVRTDTYYDLQIAQIRVDASASVITDSVITDTRSNNELCGLINIVKAEDIGDLSTLETTDKENIVSAINNVVGIIGDLAGLRTSDKESVVRSINSIITMIGDLSQLRSSDKSNLVRAINTVQWLDIVSKPFEGIDSGTLIVNVDPVSNVRLLSVKPIAWSAVNNKPFEAIDENTLSVVTVNDVLKLTVNHSNDDFVIASQTFTFTNLQCRINDTRITENSLADVYFTSATFENARKAKVSVETYNGYLVLTAENTPVGSITGTIRIRVV